MVTFEMFQFLDYKENPAIYETILVIMFHIVVHVLCKYCRPVHTTNRQQCYI